MKDKERLIKEHSLQALSYMQYKYKNSLLAFYLVQENRRFIGESCKTDKTYIKEADLEIKCDYNNLKGPIGMRFATLEYPEWEEYMPKATERDIFQKNKALAHLFEEELDRQIRTPY